ncbi:glucosamine-6-phosphate isomerase [Fictibacillus macauensis ZFHKF-1]|uniref:Glucosamine-6-phosphate deaminase n=1 Tax=Fictibacillus macauensis ZFHKF-1 TaxID=1196324 RepID=I8UF95_9BACL|nr:glucosamine-6-phosphate deaminase [Fictibacillus macauensis]EIT85560.1 glucosamine-6-phosphate isomerase [Fictibacillus macauensis ZFHKF-1]
MKIVAVADYEEMSKVAAAYIVSTIRSSSSFSLGLATGGTPLGVYQQLIKNYQTQQTSYAHVQTFNLDEYVGLSPQDDESYHAYMNHHLFQAINIPPEQTHVPNGMAVNLEEECVRYENHLQERGGVDLQLLGIGQNGHIGFNEPGTSFASRTHVVKLTPSTLAANARYFPPSKKQPTHALTMGIATILQSKEIILLASGEKKQQAMNQLLNGHMSESVPATALRMHGAVTIVADRKALQLALAQREDYDDR